MFLSIATSNIVATALAKKVSFFVCFIFFYLWILFLIQRRLKISKIIRQLFLQDKKEVQHQISMLLCVGLGLGVSMLLFTKFFGTWALTGIELSQQ